MTRPSLRNIFAEPVPYGADGWTMALIAASGTLDDTQFVVACLRANMLADALRAQVGIVDAVAGIGDVTIRVNPALISRARARDLFTDLAHECTARDVPLATKRHDIGVFYDEKLPDFRALCAARGWAPKELIAAHTSNSIRVLMMGFSPGFAYMGPVANTLRVPRHQTPRPKVSAGAVGLAEQYTSIYPSSSPGGWHIIGHSAARVFAPTREAPFLFAPGDLVRFCAISKDEYMQARP